MSLQNEISREFEIEEELKQDAVLAAIVPDEFFQVYSTLIRVFAAHHLRAYFGQKKMYAGGSFSRRLLRSEDCIKLVLNTSLIEGVERVYAAIKSGGFRETMHNGMSQQVQYVLDRLQECASLGVPKCLAGGMLLIHLHFCEGIPTID